MPLRWGGIAGLIAGLTVAVSGAAWATAAVTPPAGEVPTDDGPALDGPGLDELVTPDAPGSVTVANVDGLGGGTDTGKVIVSWSAAGDNGSAITKYTVTYGVDRSRRMRDGGAEVCRQWPDTGSLASLQASSPPMALAMVRLRPTCWPRR